VPVPWSLSKVEGTEQTGYLRLDDDEMPRLELRWSPSPGKKVGLDTVTDNYLKQARKAARKYRCPFEVQFKTKRFPAKGREVRYLTLKSDYPSHIIISRCKECGRVVLARILHQPGEQIGSTVASVFGSLSDHGRQGERVWSVFDLGFRLPESLRLASSTFRVGRIALAFRRGSERLVVERHNFARELLRGADLKQWLVRTLRKELRPFACRSEDWPWRGHQGLQLSCSLKLWRRLATLGIRNRRLSALTWHCPQADRIYLVRLTDGKGDAEQLLHCARTIECHQH